MRVIIVQGFGCHLCAVWLLEGYSNNIQLCTPVVYSPLGRYSRNLLFRLPPLWLHQTPHHSQIPPIPSLFKQFSTRRQTGVHFERGQRASAYKGRVCGCLALEPSLVWKRWQQLGVAVQRRLASGAAIVVWGPPVPRNFLEMQITSQHLRLLNPKLQGDGATKLPGHTGAHSTLRTTGLPGWNQSLLDPGSASSSP